MLVRYRAALSRISLAGMVVLSGVSVWAAVKVPVPAELDAASSASEGKAYESVGVQGSVDFSDEPPANVQSKVIDIPETNTLPPVDGAVVPAGNVESGESLQAADSQGDVSGGYSNFSIVNPSADEPFDYIVDGLRFAVTTEPPLMDGHRIQYLIDGKLIGVPRPELYLQANNLEPGDHRIEARIVDTTGKVLRAAPVTSFNLDRAADGRFLYRSTGGNAGGVSATEGVRTTEGARAAEGVGRRAK